MKKYKLREPDGTQCELCNSVAEVREHTEITAQVLKQPFYYSQWYFCKDPHCKREIFFNEKYKVINARGGSDVYKAYTDNEEMDSLFRQRICE